jgi:hypothetical protein
MPLIIGRTTRPPERIDGTRVLLLGSLAVAGEVVLHHRRTLN